MILFSLLPFSLRFRRPLIRVSTVFFSELKVKYNVTAVPKFIIINKDGEVITSKGRKEVQDKGIIAFRNWQQAAITHEAKLAQAQNNPDGDGEDEDEKQDQEKN